jgi:hypothetical protein
MAPNIALRVKMTTSSFSRGHGHYFLFVATQYGFLQDEVQQIQVKE